MDENLKSFHTRQRQLARAALQMATKANVRLPFNRLMMTGIDGADDENIYNTLRAMPRSMAPGLVLVFRHYNSRDRESIGKGLARLCRQKNIGFFVAGDPHLAYRLQADGLHLAEHQLRVLPGLRAKFSALWISTACHTSQALITAARGGADVALLSPLFATTTHKGTKPMGLLRFNQIAHRSNMPVFALGGVNETTTQKLCASNCAGIAAISAFRI